MQREMTAEEMKARIAELESLKSDFERLIDKHAQTLTERDRLRAKVENYRPDAERYRWIRKKTCIINKAGFMSGDRYAAFEILDMPYPRYIAHNPAIELDESIDAAIAEGSQT